MTVADAWLLEDDGLIDAVALDVATKGLRPARLTAEERVTVALIIQYQHRDCECHGRATRDQVIDLVHSHVWMQSPDFPWTQTDRPPRSVAEALVSSLPTGWTAGKRVRYWTDENYRNKARAREASRLASKRYGPKAALWQSRRNSKLRGRGFAIC